MASNKKSIKITPEEDTKTYSRIDNDPLTTNDLLTIIKSLKLKPKALNNFVMMSTDAQRNKIRNIASIEVLADGSIFLWPTD